MADSGLRPIHPSLVLVSSDKGFSAVIPAGGVGSRLWPLSTADRPKFLLDLLGTGASLLQDTARRVSPVAARILVVTGASHENSVRQQLPHLGNDDVVAEPSPRDSMPAIALAAALLELRHGPHVMGTFSADHVIRKPEAFWDVLRIAIETANEGEIATIGIEPREPSTGFGYIKAGPPITGISGALRVEAFTEKPNVEVARAMIAAGSHYWNAGMYVTRTDVLLGHLARLHPILESGVRDIASAWDTSARVEVLDRVWPELTRISIDHAIAEPVAIEGGVAVVPGDLDWYDIGDFAVLASQMEPGSDGVRLLMRTARVTTVDAPGAMAVGGDRPVVIVGLEDVTVVDSPDAILVLGRNSAQKVKQAMEETR